MLANQAKGFALLRAVVGVWLVWMALPNLEQSFIDRLPGMFEQFAITNPFGFYRWFLLQVAIPYFQNIGTILAVGQLLLGSALIIGFLTRFTAAVCLFYTLNMFLATSHMDATHFQFAVLLGTVFLCMSLGDAGQVYGIDGILFKEASESDGTKFKFKDKKQRDVIERLSKQLNSKSTKKKSKAAREA